MQDGILELVIKLAEIEEQPLESPITLIVGGFLVSGHVISKNKFLEVNIITAQIKNILDKNTKESLVPTEDDGERSYIHLMNAKYFVPGQLPIPGNDDVSCRIKLADVAGFQFGYLAASPEG